MQSPELEPAIQDIELPQTYALDLTDIVISITIITVITENSASRSWVCNCTSQGKVYSCCCKFLKLPWSMELPDSIEILNGAPKFCWVIWDD